MKCLYLWLRTFYARSRPVIRRKCNVELRNRRNRCYGTRLHAGCPICFSLWSMATQSHVVACERTRQAKKPLAKFGWYRPSVFLTPEELHVYSPRYSSTLLCSEERHTFGSRGDRNAALPNRAGGGGSSSSYKHATPPELRQDNFGQALRIKFPAIWLEFCNRL